ncbi:hypothetical protein [Rhodococcus qingshengii]|nr:hypothetical protein [Rhodococcus qingshengii]
MAMKVSADRIAQAAQTLAEMDEEIGDGSLTNWTARTLREEAAKRRASEA